MIKLFAVYHSKHPNSKLLLVGDGVLRAKIETWISESGCAESIILAGLRSDVSALVQAMDIFVFLLYMKDAVERDGSRSFRVAMFNIFKCY